MKISNDDDETFRRPPTIVEDDTTDEDTEDGDRYYWQPTYDDRRGNQYNYEQKYKTKSTTKRPKSRYPQVNRETTIATLLRGNFIISLLVCL